MSSLWWTAERCTPIRTRRGWIGGSIAGPGENGAIKLQLLGTSTLSAGQKYEADIVVRGFYDQRLHACAQITPDAFEQGEAPTHLPAHRW
jgi:hypothetical protein